MTTPPHKLTVTPLAPPEPPMTGTTAPWRCWRREIRTPRPNCSSECVRKSPHPPPSWRPFLGPCSMPTTIPRPQMPLLNWPRRTPVMTTPTTAWACRSGDSRNFLTRGIISLWHSQCGLKTRLTDQPCHRSRRPFALDRLADFRWKDLSRHDIYTVPSHPRVTMLASQFDTLLFDLDGVIYVGPDAVPYATAVVTAMQARKITCTYVTNNAFRTPQAVADHLTELGFSCNVEDVVTSPQAAVPLLATRIPTGSRVLVIGGEGIVQILREAGYVPVSSLDEDPQAVIQGFSPDMMWRDLAEASYAVASGLPWIATNPDLTFPTPRGIAPGNGSMVRLVSTATGREPDAVAGKPEPPLLNEALRRTGARAALMIGDRLDTDISAGHRVGIPSLLVMTGVTTARDLLLAQGDERPEFVGSDLRVLLRPYPQVTVAAEGASCQESRAWLREGALELDSNDADDGLRAAAALAWQHPGLDLEPALTRLAELAGTVSSETLEDHHAQ